ncbi:AAA family ATPase [Bacteroides thetaiotaomicron]|nr:AAA family ATPase [Bacteroides thetaiotaomicron]
MEYQSEIRDSEINELFEKVENRNYKKYLLKLTLNPIRGFRNETIRFEFPVTALIGPNGGGKTTVLGAAACAYISEKPGRFFSKSGSLDNSMQNWKILYELIDRDLNKKIQYKELQNLRISNGIEKTYLEMFLYLEFLEQYLLPKEQN